MSHPPGPPQDPYLPDPEPQWYPDPTYPDPAAPAPYPHGSPYQPGRPDPTRQMPPGSPYPTSGPPGYPPTSGAPYPPVSGSPTSPGAGYPPVAGGYPPVSGGGYPPVAGGYPPAPGAPMPPPGGGYPGAYPPGPQFPPPAGPYPGLPLPPQSGSSKGGRTALIVVVAIVVVVTLVCCVLGVIGLLASDDTDPGDGIAGPPTPATSIAPLTEPTEATRPLTAPTTAPAPEPTDGETFNMKVGDTLVITDDTGTIEITINKFSTSTKGCKSYAPEPDEGMYLIADVTARVTKGNASINPFFFEWVAESGATANGLVGSLSGCGTPLGSGVNLRSGSKRSGTVVFDVADKKGVVEYKHNFETAGSWRP